MFVQRVTLSSENAFLSRYFALICIHIIVLFKEITVWLNLVSVITIYPTHTVGVTSIRLLDSSAPVSERLL